MGDGVLQLAKLGEPTEEVNIQVKSILRSHCFSLSILLILIIISACPSFAIPAFSRMYGTSCSTCHIDFPKPNDFGKASKDAGFKFPKDDESMLKIPPVMLGAPANTELWQKAIWPGTIPGIPPIGMRYNKYLQFTSGLFSLFTAGNFGSDIAFWEPVRYPHSGKCRRGEPGFQPAVCQQTIRPGE